MPELPEVETVVRSLRPHLLGRRLGELRRLDARSVRTGGAVSESPIVRVERIGKFIRVEFDDGWVFTAHLGMSGRLIVVPADRPAAPHTHLRVALGPRAESGGSRSSLHARPAAPRTAPASFRSRLEQDAAQELRFVNPRWCMGGLWLLDGPGGPGDPTADLGPDPLRITAEQFVALADRRRQVKALLLDQRVLAGVGNIYADESLFAAGIHPRAIGGRLSRASRRRLWSALRDRLGEAIRRGGSSIRDYRDADGRSGWFQLSLAVYGRTGEPCPRCRRPVRRTVVAGRGTHYCPRCQRT